MPIRHLTTFLYIIQICNLRVLLLSGDHLADIVTAVNAADEYCMFSRSKIHLPNFDFTGLDFRVHFVDKG